MTENYIQPFGKLSIGAVKPNYNICFHQDGQEIGKLDFNGPTMIFIGNAEESAKVFIDWIAQSFENRLEEERKKNTKKDELAPIKSIATRENSKVYNIDTDSESIVSNKSSKSNISNKSSKSVVSNNSSKSNVSNNSSKK